MLSAISNNMDLSQEELSKARQYFSGFDREKRGNIDSWELRLALEAMGYFPTDESVGSMIARLDDNKDGRLELNEFLRALTSLKASEQSQDVDLLAAFIAMGGKPDGTGHINSELLRKVIRDDFGMTLKIDDLIDELGKGHHDGHLNYSDFRQLLT